MFKLRNEANAFITFEEFAQRFLHYIVELHLSKLNINSQRLTQAEFLVLLRTAFAMLKVENISESFLIKFFLLMDRSKSGVIGFEQLIHWVGDFLSAEKYEFDEYYLEDDDLDKPSGRSCIISTEVQSNPSTSSLGSSTNIKGLQFTSSPSRSRDNSRNASPHQITHPKIEPATTTTERTAKRFEIQ